MPSGSPLGSARNSLGMIRRPPQTFLVLATLNMSHRSADSQQKHPATYHGVNDLGESSPKVCGVHFGDSPYRPRYTGTSRVTVRNEFPRRAPSLPNSAALKYCSCLFSNGTSALLCTITPPCLLSRTTPGRKSLPLTCTATSYGCFLL